MTSEDPVEVVRVGDFPTQVLQLLASDADALCLVIPGNPGAARFYVPFAQALFQQGGGRMHVAVASHVGHAPGILPPQPAGHFTLADQIQHKLQFLKMLPTTPTIHLVGHSIGCWMALHVLDAIPEAQRGRAVLVCPTLERMAITPNGQRLTPLFERYRRQGVALASVLHRLPGRRALLRRLLLRRAPPAHREVLLRSMLDLSPVSIDNVLGLADEEMRTVVDRPDALLERHGARLSLWFAPDDPWNLPGMAAETDALGTGATVVHGPPSLRHSFVLFDIEPVASFVSAHLMPR